MSSEAPTDLSTVVTDPQLDTKSGSFTTSLTRNFTFYCSRHYRRRVSNTFYSLDRHRPQPLRTVVTTGLRVPSPHRQDGTRVAHSLTDRPLTHSTPRPRDPESCRPRRSNLTTRGHPSGLVFIKYIIKLQSVAMSKNTNKSLLFPHTKTSLNKESHSL